MDKLQTAILAARALPQNPSQPAPASSIIELPGVAPWRGPEHHVIAPFPRVITVNDIIKIVAAEFDMTREQIAGSYRKRKFAFARHLAQYLATRLTAQSLPVIARQFFRDHTSVLHGVRRIKLMMESDRETRMLVERLETKLRSSHEQTG